MPDQLNTESKYIIEVQQIGQLDPYVRIADKIRGDYIGIYLKPQECQELAKMLMAAAAKADTRQQLGFAWVDEARGKYMAAYTAHVKSSLSEGKEPDSLEVFMEKMGKNEPGEE